MSKSKSIQVGIQKTLSIILCSFVVSVSSWAQNKATVTGRVIDSVSTAPLSYSSIAIYTSSNKKLLTGNITNDNGDFSIDVPYGVYYAEINFMGFNPYKTGEFKLSKENPEYNLGLIRLQQTFDVLDEVVVQAEKSSMELSLDKRIFNVGKDLANSGGTASDVLMNIPSVAVDPEGNIKLRGSDNVRILIDGKPSGLVSFKGGSGLQQLQASMIERVEIITNPSARYEAEGIGGIINIVLKKDKNQGFNGSIDVITGYPANYGLAANLNYRHKKINFFINYGLTYHNQPGGGSLYQEVYGVDTTFILKQSINRNIKGLNNNIRGGLDLYFTEKSILTASYLFRRSDANRVTNIVYHDYLFTPSNEVSYTTRRQNEDEIEPNSEYSIIYRKLFEGKGHELLGEIKYLDNWESSDQVFTQHYFTPDGIEDNSKSSLQKSLNDESEKQMLFQLDYTKPFAKEGKIETGFRTSYRNMVNDYLVTQQNSSGEFDPLPGLDNVFYYDENITAAYAILGNKTKAISYQAGLRAEWTDVKTTLEETNEVNPRKYSNLFPSAHVTFSLPKENSFQVSYSRRVRRPYYNDLSPYATFSDSRNFFSGNPDLNPEFSNVYELGYIKYFEIGTLSSSLYYRDTEDKIDEIRTVNEEGNSATRPENLHSEKAYGIELASTLAITKWWKWDANFNFFHADIDGSNIVSTYKTSTYSWFTRQTSRFSLPGKVDIQLRTNYEAPQKTAQGKRKALYYADFSISKEILKGVGTINFNVLDVFNSRKSRSITEGLIFYTERTYQGRRRQFNLTFNYRIRQSKSAKSKRDAVLEG
jgi:outer membrane receptor protein involved in Fe transport